MKNQKKSTSEIRHLSTSAIYWAEKSFEKTPLTKTHFAELLSQRDDLAHIFKSTNIAMPVPEFERIEQANLKKVQRYLNYETAIPADILPAWSDCLPSPYREYLKNELADIICPRQTMTDDINRCIKELSEGITALADGDQDKIKKELTEARDAINSVLGVEK